MLRVCLLLFAALLTYARAFCDLTPKQDCSQFREEFEKALECPYGIHTRTQDGCQRWKCIEDPCIKAKCSPNDHCEAIELSSPSYQGDWFIATCVAGDICEPFKLECNELHDCFFGIQKTTDSDGCNRCECKPDPCKKKSCAAGKRCVVQKSKPSIGQEPQFSPICGTMVKAGACSTEDTSPYKETCHTECRDDATCRGRAKCCVRGCSRLCMLPVERNSTYPLFTSTYFRPVPCSTSPYGCCQDDKTPAHGPDFEGCCLLQAYGCCLDNRNPAKGPHLEGCGCQYTLHGCCPDNVTIAQGPDNQGCGCLYTQHGCCPDRYTAASGPYNEGCACNTYQFGCCADGVTTAKGPEQQGCHCHKSKYGCCGDGETHTTGPDAAGCDCSSSRHGCCPDGHTEATGTKFLGCIDAREIKQAVCSMSADSGPCHNHTAMWYYDLAYGGCSSFRYGGCDGNGNRFLTKEKCEDVCVQPSPKDVCNLPSVKGACEKEYQRWHYNSTQEQCTLFIYGGCHGNANNFGSQELCQKQCELSSVLGQCNLPIDQGSCAGNYSRWGFNSKVHHCEQFIWGGCEGNSNRFRSEAACQMHCASIQSPQCTQPQDAGNCAEKEALWSFSQSENRCLPFYYSGCGGNDNRFKSRKTCEQTCPSAVVRDKCTLPADLGHCNTINLHLSYTVRFFYDTTFKSCREFIYDGCGGNENNFITEAECRNSCFEIETTTTTTTTTTAPTTAARDPFKFCFDAIDAGPCNNNETRYAYNSELRRCVTFQYGGCGGTENNFENEAYCSYYCKPTQDPVMTAIGIAEDGKTEMIGELGSPLTLQCQPYGDPSRYYMSWYRGYEGTILLYNNTVYEPRGNALLIRNLTIDTLGRYTCQANYGSRNQVASRGLVVRAFMPKEPFMASKWLVPRDALSSRTTMQPPSTTTTTEVPIPLLTVRDKCTLPADLGHCNTINLHRSYTVRFFYDTTFKSCREFTYGGCGGNENNFVTEAECRNSCFEIETTTTTTTTAPTTSARDVFKFCFDAIDAGPCNKNETRYAYNSELRRCVTFQYGGCGGTENNFENEAYCLYYCKPTQDPVMTAIGIAEDGKTEMIGELGSPLTLQCQPYGDPSRYYMLWYRGYEGTILLYNNTVYEPRGNALLIKNLTIDTLGRYTCQANYGEGQVASRGRIVRAFMPKEPFVASKWLVSRDALSSRTAMQPPRTTTTTELPIPLLTVRCQGNIISPKLFTAALENVFKVLDWKGLGININGEDINDSSYKNWFCCGACVETGRLDPEEEQLNNIPEVI